MTGRLRDQQMYFLVNPASGGGRAGEYWQQTLPELEKQGYRFTWEYTQPGCVCQQLRQAIGQGAQLIVAVGGDGTAYEAVNGLVQDDRLIGADISLAVYPVGSACDLGRSLYPRGVPSLPGLLNNGEIYRVDLGRCAFGSGAVNYFINSFDVGAGADTCAAINAESGKVKRFLRNGPLAFKLTALKVLMSFCYTDCELELDDERINGEYIIIGCGNGAYIGGGMVLFPRADLSDGLLDLLLIPRKTRPEILQLFSRVYDGSVTQIEGAVYRQVSRVKLLSGRPIAAELDGEVPGQTPVELTVLPGLLPVVMLPDKGY